VTAGIFTKHSRTNDPAFFAIEAAGLRWLADAGPGSAKVVRVVDVSPEHIVLERVTPTRPTRDAAEAFGRALAVTHAAGAEAFGAPPNGWSGDGYIGRQPLSMRLTATWGRFYAEQRVLPYARRAQEIGNVSRRGGALVERVCERLIAGQFDDGRSPARLHGDLWSGNVIFTANGVVMIDPAAHGGHGLTDLAMLHLFGNPELPALTAAYVEAAGLDSEWESLIGLHQLHPLLVHAVSHGPSYGAAAEQTAARYA
jgi:fructosamine-3-kinase